MQRFFKYFAALLFLAVVSTISCQAQGEISLEDLFVQYKYAPARLHSFRWMKDGRHYTMLQDNRIMKYDIVREGEGETLLDGNALDTAVFEGRIAAYRFSDDESKLLLTTGVEHIYRRSTRANYYVYNRKEGILTPVTGGEKIRYCTLSPDASKVAYVYDNNLYYLDLKTGSRVQITHDGKHNAIINGASDWVYEEEFGITRTFEWSPDGKYIAYIRFDESKVPEFTMMEYHDQVYPKYVTFKYPKVGEPNSVVSVHLFGLEGGRHRTLVAKDSTYEYIPRIKWTPDSKQLCVFEMNRHQNLLNLFLYSTSGVRKHLLTETSPYYVDIHDHLRFLRDGSGFIWTSDRDGYNHIYLMNMRGKVLQQSTKGVHPVERLYGMDEKREEIYYQVAAVHGLDRYVAKVNIRTGKSAMIQQQNGDNQGSFTSTFDYYIYTYSNMNTPPVYKLMTRTGEIVRELEDNSRLNRMVQHLPHSPVRLTQVPGADGTPLNAALVYPVDFDSTKKYPLLMYVYGGPGIQMVKNRYSSFGNYWWYQMLANEGYMIAVVDNRGTGGRGSHFTKMTYMQLGKYEVEDQIAAAKFFGMKSYIDAERIGIWGWSYGGYMSSLAILKGNDVFKMAMAVAPVTNWKWYDSIYTERYMRTEKENPEGYHDNSPVYFADRLRGKFLIVHGLADDNVHFQNTAEMTKQLIAANKPYETLFYPNRNHGIYGDNARIHLFSKLTDFIHKNL